MKRYILLLSIDLILTSLAAFPAHCQQFNANRAGRSATVNGHKMFYQVLGKGSPTIIFEAGGGNDHTTWRKIFPVVSKFTTAFCYDRPGFNFSEPSPLPRTYKNIATELHNLLIEEHIHPPYVLVGHSFGGGIVRVFASLFPGEVSGLVLIDPLNENMLNGWSEDQKTNVFATIDSSVKQYASLGEKAEWPLMRDDAKAGYPEIKMFAYPDVPIFVLVAGKSPLFNWVDNLVDWYQTTFARSSEASLQVVPYSSHYIHLDEPQLVLSAIKRVVFPDAESVLMKVVKSKGIDSALAVYKTLKAAYPAEMLSEKVLNNLGLIQLSEGQIEKAIAVFKLSVKMHPDVYSTYDGLGEAYLHAGHKELAKKNFKKSLHLNPLNQNTAKKLQQLREK